MNHRCFVCSMKVFNVSYAITVLCTDLHFTNYIRLYPCREHSPYVRRRWSQGRTLGASVLQSTSRVIKHATPTSRNEKHSYSYSWLVTAPFNVMGKSTSDNAECENTPFVYHMITDSKVLNSSRRFTTSSNLQLSVKCIIHTVQYAVRYTQYFCIVFVITRNTIIIIRINPRRINI
jgi:hypothetical protein